MSRQMKIGIFLSGAFLILAVFIFIIGDLSVLFRKPGYPLFATFDTVSGLEPNAVVKMAGVKIGYVTDISLKGQKAELKMVIFPDTNVPKGSKALIATLGLLGEKYVDILPSESGTFFSAGESIEGAKTVSFDQLGDLVVSVGNEVRDVGRSLRGMMDEDSKAKFRDLVNNLTLFSKEISEFMSANRENLDASVLDVSKTARNLDARTEEIGGELEKAVSLVRSLVEENRETVKADLEKIKDLITRMQESVDLLNETLKKINSGEGTVGKLVQDPGLYNEAKSAIQDVKRLSAPVADMKASVNVRADYLGKSEKTRGSLTFSLWPAKDRFFQAQIVRDPRESRFTYSLQGGQRFGGFVPRAGLIESTFGAGLDYYAWNDRLAFSLDAFDINRTPGPHFRFSARYSLYKFFFLAAGVDDFSLTAKRQIFFGLGVGR